MQADLPFYESPEQALEAAVTHLGGAKVVGSKLWGGKSPDAARTRLLDCLNPSRTERLDLSESMTILRWAKEAGCHSPFQWIAGDIGYEARAVTKAEEVDRVVAVLEQSLRTSAAATAALERLQAQANGRVGCVQVTA